MNWEYLKSNVYYLDGSLRDIYIPNTTKENWSRWINYVNGTYKVEWYNPTTGKSEKQIDVDTILEIFNGDLNLTSTAKVFVGTTQVNVHFFEENEFENDISPKEVNQIEDHNRLIKYLTDISKLLGKEVLITPENQHEISLIAVSGDLITYE